MSQHDYVIANASGATVRADLNSLFQAMLSQNSGTSAPSTTAAGMFWLDTTGGAPYTLKVRDAGNNHWLSVASITDPGSDGNLSMAAIEGTSVLSTGESGTAKFLRVDGDGTCSWQTPASSPFVFLEKYTCTTDTSKVFNLSSYTTYPSYKILVNGVKPNDSNKGFYMTVGTSGSYQTGYLTTGSFSYKMSGGSGFSNAGANSEAQMINVIQNYNSTGYGIRGFIDLFQPQSASFHTYASHGLTAWNKDSEVACYLQGSKANTKQSDTHVKFEFESSSQLKEGTITLYGVADA